MTVTINGTTGLAGTNGSAGTPAVQGEDTNTGIFFPAADTVAVATGGAERLRLDASGNLGLGVTPSAWVTTTMSRGMQFGRGGSTFYSTDSANATFGCNNYQDGANSFRYLTNGHAARYGQSDFDGNHRWFTAPSGTAGNPITFTQAMTLEAGGNLLVGTTSTNLAAGGLYLVPGTYAELGIGHTSAAPSGSTFVAFRHNNIGIGSITQNGTTAVAYNTSSDYRLKENVQPMQNALDTVARLNPVTYTWKADGSDGQGFIAHELQAVVPDCVTGEKDAVDAEGNPQYQGVDTSFLVATLVKAIQELTARVAELEAK